MLTELPVMADSLPLETSMTVPNPPRLPLLHLKLARNDVSFPLSTPRRRAPSITSLVDRMEQESQSLGDLTIRTGDTPSPAAQDIEMEDTQDVSPLQTSTSILDLPHEVQNRILDHIFGDMHSITLSSTSLRGKSVSSLMRHPRRKAVSSLALVCPLWRDMVQERIYRHIKIKGTRPGIAESREYFTENSHLTRYIRHIEFWVPVWGDKFPSPSVDTQSIALQRAQPFLNSTTANNELGPPDLPGITYSLSSQSATLSEIFTHISIHFPSARVFTLEGGHCKKSNMIRHLSPSHLFAPKFFAVLPQIRTFAMRGAWNIMRTYPDWINITSALPNVEEWHCGYAKPRSEAEELVNEILLSSPSYRHMNISLDGMYSKDPTPTTLPSSSTTLTSQSHICENLGVLLPQLESLSYTGRICECLFTSAITSLQHTNNPRPKLKHLELVVKSCCRQRVTTYDPITGDTVVDEVGGVMADGAGITNLTFIRAFERLVLNTVEALRWFPALEHIRIRYIDLDSPCTLLNPYFLLERGRCYGLWSEEIVERLNEVRPDLRYEELSDGIEAVNATKRSDEDGDGDGEGRAVAELYPRTRPRGIKSSSYKVLAESRG